ncbi:hypothetical protein ONZ45_g7009 [Pleurotus djamor]|nr:hypothetical protein ONZ45_g7009 [Pleurotus djamor]
MSSSALVHLRNVEVIDAQVAFHAAQVAHHNDAILSLKIRRNAHSLIFSLPPELLAFIFHLVVTSSIVDSEIPGRSPYTWLVIVRVCHAWRVLALNCPELWTCISIFTGPSASEFMSAMLVRSKRLPIRVKLSTFPYMDCKDLRVLMEHAHRIKELDAFVSPQGLSELLGSASILSSLDVLRVKLFPYYSPLRFSLPTPQDWSLQIPTLRVLHLCSPFQPFSVLPTSPALTSLTLDRVDITPQELLRYLGGTPNLERLSLSGVDFEVDPDPMFVELPNLFSINMDVCGVSALALLGQLIYPTDTKITFTCAMLDYEGEDDADFDLMVMWPCLLGGCTCHNGVPVIDRLRVSVDDEGLKVSFGTEEVEELCSGHFIATSSSSYAIYDKFSTALPFSRLRYLQLSTLHQPMVPDWIDFLAPLMTVEVFQARFLGSNLFPALLFTEGLLPNLRDLELHDSSFAPMYSLTNLSDDHPYLPNRPHLKSVSFSHCQVDESAIADLSKFVDVQCPFPGNVVYEGPHSEAHFNKGRFYNLDLEADANLVAGSFSDALRRLVVPVMSQHLFY